ncbi:MAG: hypothetical protein KJ698_01760 [Actinobacteria bacterium]|jgi:hypothetical protein|nr:hypothetical protein [Actinomycetota bacterium]MBU1866180.1 hypothetical protein [Actinomycetota bacterium]
MAQLSEEMSAGTARIRVDVIGPDVPEHVLHNMDFMNYRLADVTLHPEITLGEPDLLWDRNAAEKAVSWDGRTMRFTGDWAEGPLQKAIVTVLALRMEAEGLHPFHSAAVRYRGKTVLLLGGESNHGKSMSQLEACRRGAQLISTETTVIDEAGAAVMGSKTVFIKTRAKGTERSDKAAPERGAQIFFGEELPTWDEYLEPSNVDIVLVPAIDGNFDPSLSEMIEFEKQFQTFHSLQNYFLTNELLAPGHIMPLTDTEARRADRARFIQSFCADRPFYFIRAANPQALMDEADKVV